jgi:hypothetical protein
VTAAYAHTIRALLQGRPPPPLLTERERDERTERGDAAALRADALCAALPARIDRALAAERVDVVLRDGSTLSLDDAERLLANKEDRRAHRPLRASIDDALRPHRQFRDYQIDADEARVLLERFLVLSQGLRDAALEALAALGDERPEDAASLCRALDLPDGHGAFGEAVTTHLLGRARDAAGRNVARVRAPRDLAGAVLIDAFAFPKHARFRRHQLTLEAGAIAIAGARSVGLAFALGLQHPSARRALALGRTVDERAARVACACAILQCRIDASLALAHNDDELRDLLSQALAADLGRDLTPPGWASESPAALAIDRIKCAAAVIALRDAFDEHYALVDEAWREPLPAPDDDVTRWVAAWTDLAASSL